MFKRDTIGSDRLVAALAGAVLLIGSLVLVFVVSSQKVRGAPPEVALRQYGGEQGVLRSATELPHQVYLPLIAREAGARAFRVGYCATWGDITGYPEIRGLAAGWYPNFNVELDPPRPAGIEHVQMVRLHQKTTCWPNRVRDRSACPYVKPYTYTLTNPSYLDTNRDISRAEIASIARANPGALWLIGNEMDRHDWGGVNPWNSSISNPVNRWQGQDEMLPGLYARAYHDLYYLIKNADPTAQVAIGGVIQATPARLWYVDTVWHTYQDKYGTDMPVDVWNVHNFILKERCDDWGADVPPGCPPEVCSVEYGVPCNGETYSDKRHNDMEIFAHQIVAFRRWMKEHGQRNKPLIVSEYGILYHHAGMEDLDLVRNFMLDTFDYFMTAKDPNLGYPADENRLVQRWAWFSLDSVADWNRYSYLMDPWTHRMTATGEAFASYTQSHLDGMGSDTPDYWP